MKKLMMALCVVAALTATAAERVELLNVHQEEANPYILSYTYRTTELSPAMTYQLVTTVKMTSGVKGARMPQFRVLTNNVTEANAVVATSINLKEEFGEGIDPVGSVNLWLIDTDATPVGTIHEFAGKVAPNGYLLCNGQAVSRSTYARLFAVIGTTYGTGDGSTTFALPNFSGRVAQGPNSTYSLGAYPAAGLPNIYGRFNKTDGNGGMFHASTAGVESTGALSTDQSMNTYYFTDGGDHTAVRGWRFDAASGECGTYASVSGSRSYANNVYGKSTTVQPPAVVVNKIIKY